MCVLAFAVFYELSRETVRIAFIGPLTGKDAYLGKAMLNGMQISVDHFNHSGPINTRVVLDVYDDKNEPALALKHVQSIVGQNKALAIIGHGSSDTVYVALDEYKKLGAPVLLPAATNVELTQDSNNIFRMCFNDDQQAEYMCLYAKYILQAKTIGIIFSDSVFGNGLKNLLISYAKKLDLDIRSIEPTQNWSEAHKQDLVLLATSTQDSIPVIDQLFAKSFSGKVIGADGLARALYQVNQPGKYVDKNVFAITPLIRELLDDSGERFRAIYEENFKHQMHWSSVYGYDSANILLDKLIKIKRTRNLEERRKLLVEKLSTDKQIKTPQDIVPIEEKTITKHPDFSSNFREIYFGRFGLDGLLPVSVQFTVVNPHSIVTDVDQLIANNLLLRTPYNKLFYRTNIVLAGVNINNLLSVDFQNNLCTLDFYLWLRYDESVESADNVIFINSANAMSVKEATSQSDLVQTVVDQTVDGQRYKLYRINGVFQLNHFPSITESFYLQNESLGVSFRNQLLDNRFIRYVEDKNETQTGLRNVGTVHGVLKRNGWEPILLDVYESSTKASNLGNPRDHESVGQVNFSLFNSKIVIKKMHFSVFELLDYHRAKFLGMIALILIVCSELFKFMLRRFKNPVSNKWMSVLDISVYALLLLCVQFMAMDHIALSPTWRHYRFSIRLMFDILWWFVFAWFVTLFFHRLWRRLEHKNGHPVPKLVYICVDVMIYMFAALGVLAFVLERSILSLLTSVSLIGLLAVLAVKMNVANIFSGFFLNIEGRFRVGDWVQINDTAGYVIDTSWRSTSIRTEAGNIVSIPNSNIAQASIINFSYPYRPYTIDLIVKVGVKHNPQYVIKVLQDALKTGGLIKDVVVGLDRCGRSLAYYGVSLELKNYKNEMLPDLKSNVYISIWKALHNTGIGPNTPYSRKLYQYTVHPETFNAKAVLKQAGFAGEKQLKGLKITEKRFPIGHSIHPKAGVRLVVALGKVSDAKTLVVQTAGSEIKQHSYAISEVVCLEVVEKK